MTMEEILADNVLDEVAADPTAPGSFDLEGLVERAIHDYEEDAVWVTAGAGMWEKLSRDELTESELRYATGDR